MPYTFELSRPDDDPAIRRLLRENPVPGQMALAYEREPDYFLGSSVMGPLSQTLVARQETTGDTSGEMGRETAREVVGEVVGLATRSVRPLFVNGQVENVGYIGQLRVDEAHRGRWLVPAGFRLFHRLHQDAAAQGYITTIVEGNTQAEGLLVEKARRHYPAYRRLERVFTLALIVRRPRRVAAPGVEIRTAAQVELADVIAFLHREGRRKQFFPVYSAEDFTGPATRGLRLDEMAVALQGGKIVGVLALWDQSAYKQTVVRAYGDNLRRLKPLYNLGAKLLRGQPLTPIGQPIHFAYAAFACVAGDDSALFRPLLQTVYNWAAEHGFAFLMLGLCQGDPLLPVARGWLHIPYTSALYTVCWQEDEAWRQGLDGRVPYVEIGTL
ncbi:MAG: hypothetical protein KF753_14535 [Caldilineaceae bacterium]|nr:hypothetical protein [Caldilineaceae bacterium]